MNSDRGYRRIPSGVPRNVAYFNCLPCDLLEMQSMAVQRQDQKKRSKEKNTTDAKEKQANYNLKIITHTHKHARNIKRHPSYNNLAHLLFEEVTLVLDWHLLMLLADYALCMVVYGGFVFVCLLK